MCSAVCKVSLLLSLSLFSLNSHACLVSEIVSMAEDGAGRDAIRSKCKSKADDAQSCTFSKVLDYAMAKKDEDYILKQCTPCESPTCKTRMGTCQINQNPSGAKIVEGGPCGCPSVYGWIAGKTFCE